MRERQSRKVHGIPAGYGPVLTGACTMAGTDMNNDTEGMDKRRDGP